MKRLLILCTLLLCTCGCGWYLRWTGDSNPVVWMPRHPYAESRPSK